MTLSHAQNSPDTDLALVILLPLVRERAADDLTRVLDHHLRLVDVTLTEQAAAVDGRAVDAHRVTCVHLESTEAHGKRHVDVVTVNNNNSGSVSIIVTVRGR